MELWEGHDLHPYLVSDLPCLVDLVLHKTRPLDQAIHLLIKQYGIVLFYLQINIYVCIQITWGKENLFSFSIPIKYRGRGKS